MGFASVLLRASASAGKITKRSQSERTAQEQAPSHTRNVKLQVMEEVVMPDELAGVPAHSYAPAQYCASNGCNQECTSCTCKGLMSLQGAGGHKVHEADGHVPDSSSSSQVLLESLQPTAAHSMGLAEPSHGLADLKHDRKLNDSAKDWRLQMSSACCSPMAGQHSANAAYNRSQDGGCNRASGSGSDCAVAAVYAALSPDSYRRSSLQGGHQTSRASLERDTPRAWEQHCMELAAAQPSTTTPAGPAPGISAAVPRQSLDSADGIDQQAGGRDVSMDGTDAAHAVCTNFAQQVLQLREVANPMYLQAMAAMAASCKQQQHLQKQQLQPYDAAAACLDVARSSAARMLQTGSKLLQPAYTMGPGMLGANECIDGVGGLTILEEAEERMVAQSQPNVQQALAAAAAAAGAGGMEGQAAVPIMALSDPMAHAATLREAVLLPPPVIYQQPAGQLLLLLPAAAAQPVAPLALLPAQIINAAAAACMPVPQLALQCAATTSAHDHCAGTADDEDEDGVGPSSTSILAEQTHDPSSPVDEDDDVEDLEVVDSATSPFNMEAQHSHLVDAVVVLEGPRKAAVVPATPANTAAISVSTAAAAAACDASVCTPLAPLNLQAQPQRSFSACLPATPPGTPVSAAEVPQLDEEVQDAADSCACAARCEDSAAMVAVSPFSTVLDTLMEVEEVEERRTEERSVPVEQMVLAKASMPPPAPTATASVETSAMAMAAVTPADVPSKLMEQLQLQHHAMAQAVDVQVEDACACDVAEDAVVAEQREERELETQLEQLGEPSTWGMQLRLHGLVGRGSYGCVYRGSWNNKTVAVKVTRLTAAQQAAQDAAEVQFQCRAAEREAHICMGLDHPNVVVTYSALRNKHLNGTFELTLIQELCNTDLRQMLNAGILHSGKPYSPCGAAASSTSCPGGASSSNVLAAVLQVAADVAAGMAYLEAVGILHGDLNPRNVLITAAPKRGPLNVIAKVTDFGLSHRMPHGCTWLGGITHGTQYYSAPELQEQGILCPQGAVFSFGVLLWEMFTGTPPYVTIRDDPSGQSHFEWRRTFPQLPASCPPQFVRLVRACLQLQPARRPSWDQVIACISLMRQELVLDGCHFGAVAAAASATCAPYMEACGCACSCAAAAGSCSSSSRASSDISHSYTHNPQPW